MIYNYVINMYNDSNYYAVSIEAATTKTRLDEILLTLFKDVRYVNARDNRSARDTGMKRIADGCYITKCRFIWDGNSAHVPVKVKKAQKVVPL